MSGFYREHAAQFRRLVWTSYRRTVALEGPGGQWTKLMRRAARHGVQQLRELRSLDPEEKS